MCMVAPLQGLVEPRWYLVLLSGGLSMPREQCSGRHRNGLAVHFRTTFYGLSTANGLRAEVAQLPLGRETFLPFRGGQE